MLLLIGFAFLAGIVTVLSPCILPVLPIILSSTDKESKQKPLGVIVGFVTSFTFFTLFLSTIVRLLNFPADNLRVFSIVVLILFGVSLLLPKFQLWIEILFSRISGLVPVVKGRSSFIGGILIGLSLGLLWTPCVGPILASVISLSIVGEVNIQAMFITLAYSLGTAIPMFLIMITGSNALQKVPWLVKRTGLIQKLFGILMILTAVGIFFNIDRRLQTKILEIFPNYGVGLTKFEDNEAVRKQLEEIGGDFDKETMGKPTSEMNTKGPLAPEIIRGGEWINSSPLELKSLRGKVVLVDFWTYSCVNCLRTLPYLKGWWEKYKDLGLVIIGVHSPEFEFEKELNNLTRSVSDLGIRYPVVQDNDFATWRAYENRYWPAKYLIDKDGYVRYTHFGEGEYDLTEKYIQTLLTETGEFVDMQISNPSYQIYSRTPEIYLGYERLQWLSSPEKIAKGQIIEYTKPPILKQNSFAFEGNWLIDKEFSVPEKGSKLLLRFEAKEVFLVTRPKNGTSGSMKIKVNGNYFGADANEVGEVLVTEDRLYQIINLPKADQELLEIEFLNDNVAVYAFTFG